MAHAKGVYVEAELGKLGAVEDDNDPRYYMGAARKSRTGYGRIQDKHMWV